MREGMSLVKPAVAFSAEVAITSDKIAAERISQFIMTPFLIW
jgi:hypothetical protein